MIDKSHCKMAFETDDDRIEMSDFYTYEGEGGVGDEWEDVDDAGGTDGGLETSQSHVSLTVQIYESGKYAHGIDADSRRRWLVSDVAIWQGAWSSSAASVLLSAVATLTSICFF